MKGNHLKLQCTFCFPIKTYWSILFLPGLGEMALEEKHQVESSETVGLDQITPTPNPCGGTIILDQTSPVVIFNSTYQNSGGSSCFWYIQSPSNTHIIIEFHVFSFAYDDIYSYDSRGRRLLYMQTSGSIRTMSMSYDLNPVISDSYARLEFFPYYSSYVYVLSVEVHFSGKVAILRNLAMN